MSWEPGPTSYDRKRTAQTQSLVPAPCEKWRTEWHYKVHITGGGEKSEWSQKTYIMWTVNNWKMSQKQCHRTLVTGGEKKKKKRWRTEQGLRTLGCLYKRCFQGSNKENINEFQLKTLLERISVEKSAEKQSV